MTEPHAAPALRRRELAHALREHRENAGLRATEVAQRLGFSASKLSRIETGNRPIALDDLERLCSLYDVTEPERERLSGLAVESRETSQWQKLGLIDSATLEFADLEYAAVTIQ